MRNRMGGCLLIAGIIILGELLLPVRSIPQSPTQTIGNGQVAKDGDHPWTGFLRIIFANGNSGNCGCGVLSSRVLITAAHCLRRGNTIAEPSSVMITLGVANLLSNQPWQTVASRLILHPDYRSVSRNYADLALIITEKQIPLDGITFIRKLALPEPSHNFVGYQLSVAGWGYTSATAIEAPDNLHAGSIEVVDRDACKAQLYHFASLLTDGMICGKGPDTLVCQGDSGGPLVAQRPDMDPEIVGIMSWGLMVNKCPTTTHNTHIFSQIGPFRHWILAYLDMYEEKGEYMCLPRKTWGRGIYQENFHGDGRDLWGPTGFTIEANNRAYRLFDEGIGDWDIAANKCEEFGARLPVLSDEETIEIVQKYRKRGGRVRVWLGLQYQGKPRGLVWVDGRRVTDYPASSRLQVISRGVFRSLSEEVEYADPNGIYALLTDGNIVRTHKQWTTAPVLCELVPDQLG